MLHIQTGETNEILRTKCEPVTEFDSALVTLIKEMEETMLSEDPKTGVKGVGLAGNQVGEGKRILLITQNVCTRKDHKVLAMVNPEILELSKKEVTMEEGCLSLPEQFAKISRPAKVKVRWQNVEGNWCEKKLVKWDARIFLHEYDHLEGVLFTDYLKEKS
jgi:peptide deformylase